MVTGMQQPSEPWCPHCRTLGGQVEDALMCFENQMRRYLKGLVVDGWDVAAAMVEILSPDSDEAPLTEAERRHDAYVTDRDAWERDALAFGEAEDDQ